LFTFRKLYPTIDQLSYKFVNSCFITSR